MAASKCSWLQVQVPCELEKAVSPMKYGSARTSDVKAPRTAAPLDRIMWSLFREQNKKGMTRINFALDLQIILPSNKQGGTFPPKSIQNHY